MSWSFWLYAAPWVLFTGCLLLYGLRSPWWTSSTGRALIVLYAALSGVLGLVVAVQLFHPPEEWRALLRVLTLAPLTVAGVGQLANIIRLQHRRRGRERERVEDRT